MKIRCIESSFKVWLFHQIIVQLLTGDEDDGDLFLLHRLLAAAIIDPYGMLSRLLL